MSDRPPRDSGPPAQLNNLDDRRRLAQGDRGMARKLLVDAVACSDTERAEMLVAAAGVYVGIADGEEGS